MNKYQIQSYERIILQVVKDGKSKKNTEELEDYLRDKYAGQFDDDTVIEFDWRESLPPDKNRKIRVMVSEIKEQ